MAPPEVSRRDLLRQGAALSTGAVAAGIITSTARAQDTQPSEDPQVVAGVIERVEPPNSLVLRREEGSTVVTFTPDATFWKDRKARLEDFIPGDEVVVEGTGAPRVFEGSYMITTLRKAETIVERRDGPRLMTAVGPLVIIPETRVLPDHDSKRLDEIEKSDRIIALYRVDPSSPDLVALSVGVV